MGKHHASTSTPVVNGDQQTNELRWEQVRKRELGSLPPFVYAVKTTGVYCRPGCSSRLPKRENVTFFDHASQAELAGFRACKRCKPNDVEPNEEKTQAIQHACALIERSKVPLSLEELSAAVDYSPAHFHRLFTQVVGVTPKAYAATHRANRVRCELLSDSTIAAAAYQSGYGTSSQFYEESDKILGMRPSEFRGGGKGVTIQAAVSVTSLGPILIAATDKGLCAIEFGDKPQEMLRRIRERFSSASFIDTGDFQSWVDQVVQFIDTPSDRFPLPLDIQGTAFQHRVWEAVRKIPIGSTATYSEIAKQIGIPKAARAVAKACASNQIAVAIPCHRVVRRDGKLGGYRWGIERKQALLDRETK